MNITGRDDFIVSQALALAIAAIEWMPEQQRPESDARDMLKLLEHLQPNASELSFARKKVGALLRGYSIVIS